MASYKLLSFDVWDTIIRRKCHPDEIKLHTARYIYLNYYAKLLDSYKDYYKIYEERCTIEGETGQDTKSRGFDDEYLLNDVIRTLLLRITAPLETTEEEIDELIQAELEQEKRVSYLDPAIEQKMSIYQTQKTIFISDFYTDQKFLKQVLEHVGSSIKFDKGYVSSEILLNKRSGKLFKHVHSELLIKPEEHVHVGDSLHADYHPPKSLGIEAVHYINETEEEKRKINGQIFAKRMKERKLNFDALAFKQHHQSLNQNQNEFYNLGKEHSIIFFAFVMEIIEQAVKEGYSTVYYLTREGEFFKKLHDTIVKYNPYGFELPQSELLEVSRIATFAPSIREVTLSEFMRLWNQYSTQSFNAFFMSLDVEAANFESFLSQYGINPAEDIQYPWLDEKVIRLFNDEQFCTLLENKLREKKELFLAYLQQKGIDPQTEKVLIVDIGWRGTIQDNIAYMLQNTFVEGYYLGLYEFINQQPANTKKHGFISTEEMNRMLRFVAPVEMMTNSSSGSVLRYEAGADNIKVIKAADKAEDVIHEKYIQYFQQGVIEAGRGVTEFVQLHSLLSSDLKTQALDKLQQLVNFPPRILAKAFFELAHNETFGVGKYVSKKAKFPYKAAIKGILSKRHLRAFKTKLEDSSWPQGLLILYRFEFLNKVYNRHIEKVTGGQTVVIGNDTNSELEQLKQESQAQKAMLEERYAAMMEMEKMIIERDNTIANQDRIIAERDAIINDLKRQIEEQEQKLKKLESLHDLQINP